MTDTLSALRAQIDAIDDQLFALFKERIEIVRRVGELKSQDKNLRCYVRSGREADMIRRVYSAFKDNPFSAQAAAAMWRQVISASLHVEKPMTVSLFAPEGDASLYIDAREYFGSLTAMTREPHTQRVVADVVSGRAQIGLLPLAGQHPAGDWWLQLAREGDLPKIFAYVPFVTSKAAHKKNGGWAIAYVTPEKTASDKSLYSLRTDGEISQSRLNAAFVGAGVAADWCDSATPQPDQRLYLVEVDGFRPEGDSAMNAFKHEAGASLKDMIYLGAYATPILTD